MAAFLRAEFARASRAAQADLVARLTSGPPPEELARLVEFDRFWRHEVAGDTPPAPSATSESAPHREASAEPDDTDQHDVADARVAKLVAEWQARRLRWFHDRILPALQQLAHALGVEARVPSSQDQALDEVGSWSSGGYSRGFRSPVEPEVLARMTPSDILAFLEAWRPADDCSWDPEREDTTPSLQGLIGAVQAWAGHPPSNGSALAALMVERLLSQGAWAPDELIAEHIEAVLGGYAYRDETQPAAAFTRPEWPAIRNLMRYVLTRGRTTDLLPRGEPAPTRTVGTDETPDDAGEDPDADRCDDAPSQCGSLWQGAVRLTIDVVRRLVERELVSPADAEDLWTILRDAATSPLLWSHSEGPAGVTARRSLSKLASASFSAGAGRLVDALFAVARWEAMALEGTAADAPAGSAANTGGQATSPPTRASSRARLRAIARRVASRLMPALDDLLARAGPEGEIVRAALGVHLATAHWFDPSWVRRRAPELLGEGDELERAPAWALYLARGRFSAPLFRVLRAQYVRAAGALTDATPTKGGEGSPSQGLALHIMVAVQYGVTGLRDPDDLVARVLGAVPVEDRGHAYWAVCRSWSDERAVSPARIRRLLAFWAWRLDALERRVGAPPNDERSQSRLVTRSRAEGARIATASSGVTSEGGLTSQNDVRAEAGKLLWFLATPHLPPAGAITLGLRTVRLVGGRDRTAGVVWGRLPALAAAEPDDVIALLEELVRAALAADHPYVPHADVGPALRSALWEGTHATRARAQRLIHTLGDRGLLEFGGLLTERPDNESAEETHPGT
jgi:hypothetical protein